MSFEPDLRHNRFYSFLHMLWFPIFVVCYVYVSICVDPYICVCGPYLSIYIYICLKTYEEKIQTQTTHNQQTKQHTKHRTHRKLNNTNTKRINSIHIEQNKKTQHEQNKSCHIRRNTNPQYQLHEHPMS